MLEAVTTTLMNGVYTRVEAQKIAPQPVAVRPAPLVQSTVAAPYISPYVMMSETSSRAILAVRDTATGNVTRQYPSERQLRAYQRTDDVLESALALPDDKNPGEDGLDIKI